MTNSKLENRYLVTKRNSLNEFRPNGMSLQELRFFTIYLSKINPLDESTRKVRFSLNDFQSIMEFTSRPHVSYFKNVVDGLLSKIIGIPDEKGTGMIRFPFFKECRISEDEEEGWYVEIDAHDRALPWIFNFKSHYMKYELWNALRLKSKNQLRMYEILKQHEAVGYRVIEISELKNLLGIEESEYSNYKDFRRDVLEVCRKALMESTDICFSYEVNSRQGRGGKIHKLKFFINKNKNHQDPLHLERFLNIGSSKTYKNNEVDSQRTSESIHLTPQFVLHDNKNHVDDEFILPTINHPKYEERIRFLMTACDDAFTREEMIVLYSLMAQKVPHIHFDEMDSFDYLQHKYRELEVKDSHLRRKGEKIGNRYAYFKKMLEESG